MFNMRRAHQLLRMRYVINIVAVLVIVFGMLLSVSTGDILGLCIGTAVALALCFLPDVYYRIAKKFDEKNTKIAERKMAELIQNIIDDSALVVEKSFKRNVRHALYKCWDFLTYEEQYLIDLREYIRTSYPGDADNPTVRILICFSDRVCRYRKMRRQKRNNKASKNQLVERLTEDLYLELLNK